MEKIKLPRPVAISLLQHAQSSPRDEVCGLIAADGEALRVIPVRNVSETPERHFEMDEAELINAMKTLREQGEVLYAIYHSHPRSAPAPSVRDLERSGYPDALHLIISMETKGVLQLSGWRFVDGDAKAVEVTVREDT